MLSNAIRLNHVTTSRPEVEGLFPERNPFSSLSPDGILPHILRVSFAAFARIHSHLIRNCLEPCILSTPWEKAVVGPIFEKEALCQLANYKPFCPAVSNSRVLKGISRPTILVNLYGSNFPSSDHHHLLPGRYNANIPCLMDNLKQPLDEGLVTQSIFSDTGKAFERLPQIPLLYYLGFYSISTQF